MELDLPQAESGRLAEEETETRKVIVNVPQSGQLLIGAVPTDRNRLKEHFLSCYNKWGEDTEVRIRMNKDIPYGEIEPILVLAAECGIWDVSFAVTEKH